MAKENALVVGSGAREHALGWKLRQSLHVRELYFAPGNAGTEAVGRNLDIEATDLDRLQTVVSKNDIKTVVVGPEAALAAGVVDAMNEMGIAAFGPTQKATRLESSKIFSHNIMGKYGIPHPEGYAFRDVDDAIDFARHPRFKEIVIKADGLTAGKGVVLPEDFDEAEKAIREMMEEKIYGKAGEEILIQERVYGPETSFICFVSDRAIVPLVPTRDYKRLKDNDEGPNTGGMGVVGPVDFPAEKYQYAMEKIVRPTVIAMSEEGNPLYGFLYTQLIETAQGLKALEYNVRGGDPETQVHMRLLRGDFGAIVRNVVKGGLYARNVKFSDGVAVALSIAAEGYPKDAQLGANIHGLSKEKHPEVVLFQAGTKKESGTTIVNGGRVLSVTAVAPTLSQALERAYGAVGEDGVYFKGMQYRKDIGK